MNLFIIEDPTSLEISPSPESLAIPVFANIVVNSKDTTEALKKFAYIFHLLDTRSPYISYESEQREKELKITLFDDENWEPDEYVEAGIDLYQTLYMSPAELLLDAAIGAIHKSRAFLNHIDISVDSESTYKEVAEKAKILKDVNTTLERLPKTLDSLTTLREKVNEERLTSNKIRGDLDVDKRYAE